MSAKGAANALAAYSQGAAGAERSMQIAALIADLLDLADEPTAVLEAARARYDKEHPASNATRSQWRRLDSAKEVAEYHREQWKAIRRSLGSLRGNITRAANAGDTDRVERLRERELELRAQERAARISFSEAATKARVLNREWFGTLDELLDDSASEDPA